MRWRATTVLYPLEHECKSIDDVIEEALRYIGGYIVKKKVLCEVPSVRGKKKT